LRTHRVMGNSSEMSQNRNFFTAPSVPTLAVTKCLLGCAVTPCSYLHWFLLTAHLPISISTRFFQRPLTVTAACATAAVHLFPFRPHFPILRTSGMTAKCRQLDRLGRSSCRGKSLPVRINCLIYVQIPTTPQDDRSLSHCGHLWPLRV
jgi:hypothetical protein